MFQQIEQELQTFKSANPNWITRPADRYFVASYNILLAKLIGNNNLSAKTNALTELMKSPDNWINPDFI